MTGFKSNPNPLRRDYRARPILLARSLGYACLILIALAPRHAMAQTSAATSQPPRTYSISLSPGESTTSMRAPRDAAFRVSLTTPEYLCGLPYTVGAIERRVAYWAAQTAPGLRLQDTLSRMENYGAGTGAAIANAFAVFLGVPASGSSNSTAIYYTGGTATFTQTQLAGGPYTHAFRTDCHTVDEARTILNEIRRGVRAYLGLPAPTN